MDQLDAIIAQQLDRRLKPFTRLELGGRPAQGWIKTIRQSLGMTASQLAYRLGITQPSVTALEQSEAAKSISLETLERAAQALGGRLVYAIVPEKPIAKARSDRAREVARRQVYGVNQHMRLEDQTVDSKIEERHIAILASKLLESRKLWAED